MSLDLDLNLLTVDIKGSIVKTCVADYNWTHNLNNMAQAAGIHSLLWHLKTKEDLPVFTALQIYTELKPALLDMHNRPEHYKKYNDSNGWGTYDDFIVILGKLLKACEKYPQALVEVSI